jgi:hypothetical protein
VILAIQRNIEAKMSRDENSGILFMNPEYKDEQDQVYASGKLFVGEDQHELEAWKVFEVNRGDVLELRCKAKKSGRVSGDGDGELERTDKTGKSDKYPDWKGNFKMKDGRAYEMAGWRRKSKAGNWFLSLSIKEKTEQAERKPEPQQDQETNQEAGQESFPF